MAVTRISRDALDNVLRGDIKENSTFVLKFYSNGSTRLLWVWGGIFEFLNNTTTILADRVEFQEDIDVKTVYEEEQEALRILQKAEDNQLEDKDEVLKAQKALREARLRLKFTRIK